MISRARRAHRYLLFAALSGLAAGVFAAPPSPAKVVVFGASWCGPCGIVRQYLDQHRVKYEYVDISVGANRDRYPQATTGPLGSLAPSTPMAIPLVMVGEEAVLGANLLVLQTALERAKLVRSPALKTAASPDDIAAGQTPAWWRRQCSDLRARLSGLAKQIAQAEAAGILSAEAIAELRADSQITLSTLRQLQLDAAAAHVPAEYCD